jgi:hypothetical protein
VRGSERQRVAGREHEHVRWFVDRVVRWFVDRVGSGGTFVRGRKMTSALRDALPRAEVAQHGAGEGDFVDAGVGRGVAVGAPRDDAWTNEKRQRAARFVCAVGGA